MENDQFLDLRNNLVIKANELIQRSRFNLSLQQQKIVLYLISQITPYDESFECYEFSIGEFCRVCGISDQSGKNCSDLKNAVKEISDKSVWIRLDDGTETLLRWIEKPYIDSARGIIKIRLDEDMKPYLLQLRKNFTQYELFWTLRFRSKYSIRLYELVKSMHYRELESYTCEFSLEELRTLMGAETYPTWQKLKDRALMPAIEEINKFSDKNIQDIEAIKEKRSVVGIRFTITTKAASERCRLMENPDFQV